MIGWWVCSNLSPLFVPIAAVERLNLGCYEDRHQYEGDKRDLDFGYKGDPKGMNVDFCVKHCADLGYKYAGVQVSRLTGTLLF